jgi:acyl carrier protein
MTSNEIFELVADQLYERIKVAKALVTMDASLTDDLNLDSLDLVELVMALEDRFKLRISDEDAGKLQTVGDAVRFIEQAVPAA